MRDRIIRKSMQKVVPKRRVQIKSHAEYTTNRRVYSKKISFNNEWLNHSSQKKVRKDGSAEDQKKKR